MISKYFIVIDKLTRTPKQYSYAYNFSKIKATFALYLFWGGLSSCYNISGSLMFLHQRRTHKQQILMLEISHIIFFLFQSFSVFNKIFLGLLQSPVTKNDHSKSSFDGFHYHKMISHSRPISRKLKSFKVWWEQLLMENRTMNWVFDLGFINCDLNVKRKAN